MSQERYINKVLERFCMDKARVVTFPLSNHFNLKSSQGPSTYKEKENMKNFPYTTAVGSLMYAMVCTRPDIAYVVGVVSHFLLNPGRERWDVVKWILRYLQEAEICFVLR